MVFLPEDYKSPAASDLYLKLKDGETRFRILSKPILGWEDWKDKKPIRYRMEDKPQSSFDPQKPLKHFWAFIVYNYNEGQIQIMEITQATIRKKIEALCRDKDWGAPYGYDIKITRSGDNAMNTEYNVNPVPHRSLDPVVVEAFYNRPCHLEALFTGEDPFSPNWGVHTMMEVISV